MSFGVIGRTCPGMRQGLGIGPQEGVLLGANFGRAIVTNKDFMAYVCDSAVTRPSSQITLLWAELFLNGAVKSIFVGLWFSCQFIYHPIVVLFVVVDKSAECKWY